MNKTAVVAALLTALAPLTAQERDPQTRARAPEAVTVTLEFAGGSLEQFVREVRRVQPKANIVLATVARPAQIPAMVLRNAGLEQALDGACMAAEAEFMVRVKEFRGPGEPVYSIVAEHRQRPAVAKTVQSMQRVFSLANLSGERSYGVKGYPVRTILSALEAAMSDEQSPPRIRYHEGSGLLLVRGNGAQIALIEDALRVLERELLNQEQRAMQRPGPRAGGSRSSNQRNPK